MIGLIKAKLWKAEAEAAEAEMPPPAAPDETETEDADDSGARSLAPFRARFRAWWEGYDYEPDEAEDERIGGGEPAARVAHPAGWSNARCDAVQSLWSKGFSTPGEAEHVMMLVKPLGLDEKNSVIDLSAGLGGSTRVIASETGAGVTGFESDPELVAAGMKLSVMAGMAKRAPVVAYKPPVIDARDKSVDAVISKEAIYALPEKETLFEEMYRVLKPVGQVLFTDYVVPEEGHGSPALEQWIASEHPTPMPWCPERTVARLRDLGFEVRIAEDMTAVLKGLVVNGWKNLANSLRAGAVHKETALAIADEAELWTRRLALFDSGDLRCYRFHAMKHEPIFK
jgi:ubiquinone/menaquinone biosynthesis C-methylase UbiE